MTIRFFQGQEEDNYRAMAWLDDLPSISSDRNWRGQGRGFLAFFSRHWVLPSSILMVGFAIAGFLYLFGLSAPPSAYSASEERLVYQISGQKFTVERNLVRGVELGLGDVVTALELHAGWPHFDGFQPAKADAFGATLMGDPVLRIKISPSFDQLTPKERLEQIYSRFFEGKVEDGPEGLVVRKLRQDSPYAGERVYYKLRYAPAESNLFVARCQTKPLPNGIPICLRELALSDGLAAVYRFPLALAEHWQELDERVLAFLNEKMSNES